MPYGIERRDTGWCVVKADGVLIHCHDTESSAKQQVKALYAAEGVAKDHPKVDLRAVNYRIADSAAMCAGCQHFEPEWSGCARVAGGTIRPDFTCDLHDPATAEQVTMAGMFKVAKTAVEHRQVFGWAYVSVRKDGGEVTDWSDEQVDVADLEAAAYAFTLTSRESGDAHESTEATGHLIESVVFTKEKQAALGLPAGAVPEGWWVGFQYHDDDQFRKVKEGERLMFSIEGEAIKEKA